MYLDDLTNSTEVILGEKRRILAPGAPRHPLTKRGAGSASRAAVGVVRIGKAVGAGVMNRRVLDPVEARLMVVAGLLLLTFAVLVALLPALLAYPSAAVAAWFAFALLVRAWKLHGNKERESSPSVPSPFAEYGHGRRPDRR
jgi:cardiolipin synthase